MTTIFILGVFIGTAIGIALVNILNIDFSKLFKYFIEKLRIQYFKEGITNHKEFKIGDKFICSSHKYLVTDIGTRTINAIQLDEVETITYNNNLKEIKETLNEEDAEKEGWFWGPPYSVSEIVFDEYDLEGCHKI